MIIKTTTLLPPFYSIPLLSLHISPPTSQLLLSPTTHFSCRVMSSEFRQPKPVKDSSALENYTDNLLRLHLLKTIKKYPEIFNNLPVKITYEIFYNNINKNFTRFVEGDAKKIFEILDTENSGKSEFSKLCYSIYYCTYISLIHHM